MVRVGDLETRAADTLRLLAKAQMADQLIDALWRSEGARVGRVPYRARRTCRCLNETRAARYPTRLPDVL